MRVPNVLFSGGEPVPETEARALAVHDALDEHLADHVADQWAVLRNGSVAAVGALVVGLALVATGLPAWGGVVVLLGLAAGGGAYYRVTTMEPEVAVTGMEKGHWTAYVVSDDDGSLVFDATESVRETEFSVDLLPDAETAEGIRDDLADIGEFPVLLEDDDDVESAFLETLSDVETAIDRAETHRIRAPLFGRSDDTVGSLSRLLDHAGEDPIDAGGTELSLSAAVDQVEALTEFEEMVDEDRGESVLQDVSEQSRKLANDLSNTQAEAVRLLNDHVATAGDYFGLVTYNFYCPDCVSDDIESRLEAVDDEWYCDTCRSEFPIGTGVPRHRIRDDLLLDVIDQLWVEKDDELRELYENIEDQKTELEEREFEQRREEIRTVGDRIKEVRGRIRDLRTEAKSKRGAIDRIGALMVKYDRLKHERKEAFQQDVAETFEEVDRRTEQVIEETRDVVQGRIEEAEKEAKEKAALMREEERAMRREELAFQEAMAERRHQEELHQRAELTAAEMEQRAGLTAHEMEQRGDLTGAVMDQQAEHQREHRLFETSGYVYSGPGRISRTLNVLKDTKDSLKPGRRTTEG